MPYKNNYGYWTDNNLKLNDFKTTFVTSEISAEKGSTKNGSDLIN